MMNANTPTLYLSVTKSICCNGLRLACLVSLLAITACANRHQAEDAGGGVSVHTFRRSYNNAHLVVSGKAMILVDAGLPADAEGLAADIRGAGFDPSQIAAIVVTHGHTDHAGGAGWFKKQFGTKVIAGKGDSGMLVSGQNEPLCPTSDSAKDDLAKHQDARYEGYSADVLIDDRRQLSEFAAIPGEIVPLPGHTEGSLILLLPNAAVVGDLLRGAIVGNTAERHFYMCDLDDNDRDIRHLLSDLGPKAKLFFAGHFGPVDREAVQERFGAKP